MLRLGIQIEKKHGFGVIDSDGFELHVTVTVASDGYLFHRLSFRDRPQAQSSGRRVNVWNFPMAYSAKAGRAYSSRVLFELLKGQFEQSDNSNSAMLAFFVLA